MKLKIIVFALLGAALFIQSCIPSIHPIYTEDKLVEVKEIPGVWVNRDDGGGKTIADEDEKMQITINPDKGQMETWSFQKFGEKSYSLIHVDEDGRPAAFLVHIIRLGKNYFMDFYPTDMPSENEISIGGALNYDNINSFKAIHLFPVHTFAKMELENDKLTIRMFDPDFLQDLFEKQQIRIKHEELEDGGYILTASSEDLQKFAEKYADVKEAYIDEPITLKNKL